MNIMGKYIKYYDTHLEYDGEKNLLDLPSVAWCELEEDVHYADEDFYRKQYLTFDIVEDGTLIWKTEGSLSDYLCNINYSIDNGTTWTQISPSLTPFLNVNKGLKILFKGTNSLYTYFLYSSSFCKNIFGGTALFNVSGNIMSMIGGDNFINTTNINYESKYHVFDSFFMNCNIVNAKNLILPTNVADTCYASMFKNCSNLISAPKLPATTLESYCYDTMFFGCTSLINAPELPATTLDTYCYIGMFAGCTSLTTAPVLPSTSATYGCYNSMFKNCTSLTTAPVLSATILWNECYNYMFQGCTNLNYIKAMFTTTPSGVGTYNWVDGVASRGTFVKNSAATWNVTGANGIPSGWTVVTADS